MKKLRIEVLFDGKSESTIVPYVCPSRVTLPDVYPFNKNFYTGPDTGFSMRYLCIKENGNIDYCDSVAVLENGVCRFSPFKNDLFVFNFEILED